MLLTTKARYAVMAVLDIAQNSKNGAVSLKDVSSRQNIALNYLEQIMNKLSKASILRSIKGPGGGYMISSSKITLDFIIDAVEESIKMTRCRDGKTCMPDNKIYCNTHYLWEGLGLQIRKYFENISLDDLITGKFKKDILINEKC